MLFGQCLLMAPVLVVTCGTEKFFLIGSLAQKPAIAATAIVYDSFDRRLGMKADIMRLSIVITSPSLILVTVTLYVIALAAQSLSGV